MVASRVRRRHRDHHEPARRLHRARSGRPRPAASPHRRGDPLRHPRRRRRHHRQRPPLRHDSEGDLILTPPMCWHGHINESDHRIIWFDAANMPLIRAARRQFLRAGRSRKQRSSGRSTTATSVCGPRPACGADVAARAGRIRRSTAIPARRRAGCWRRCRAGPDGARTVRYINPATGGAVMPDARLLRDAAAKGAPTRPQAHHLQHDLPGGVRRRAARPSASRRSNGRSTTCSRSRTGPSRATRRKGGDADLFIVSDKSAFERARSVARGTAISAARADNRRRKASARRCAASRTRASSPARGRFVADIDAARRTALRAGALAARACPHPRRSTRRGGRARPASSPSSPAPTWPPTASARCGRSGSSARATASRWREPPRYALARDTVRHVGEPVAAVIAETRGAGGRRRRAGRGRLRAAAGRHRRARRAGARRAAAARGRARQRLLPLGARRRGGGAGGVRRRRTYGRDRPRQQPPDRRGDRAARRVRRRPSPAPASSRSRARRRCRITFARR